LVFQVALSVVGATVLPVGATDGVGHRAAAETVAVQLAAGLSSTLLNFFSFAVEILAK
jgi:hypothetical protein